MYLWIIFHKELWRKMRVQNKKLNKKDVDESLDKKERIL